MTSVDATPKPLGASTSGAAKRLEYLRGKQPTVGNIIKFLGLGGVAIWFIVNIDTVNSFFDSLISLGEKAIYAGILAAAGYLLWQVLSSKLLRETVTMLIDRLILKFHKWIIARDKFGSAEFAISRLEKRKEEADEARASVYGAYQAVTKQVDDARDAAEKALANAKGFERELNERASGGKGKTSMSEEGLRRGFASAKSTLRINAAFLKRQLEKQKMLARRCNMLQVVGEATTDKLAEMRLQLQRAREDWELALQTMQAMQKSDEVVEGRDAQVYTEALMGIEQEADFFNGRVMMFMDKLDPTVQSYQAKRAGEQLEDEDYYQSFLAETKITPKGQEQQVEAESAPFSIVESAEELLGVDAEAAPTKTTPRTQTNTSGTGGGQFGNLLRRR